MGISKTSKEKTAPQACCAQEGGRESHTGKWGSSELFCLTSSPTQERESYHLILLPPHFMTNQYQAATELQLCIVPADFRILSMNWPSAAAGEGAEG